MKLLEENRGKTLITLNLAMISCILTPKAEETTEKIDESDFIKFKNFSAPRNTIKRM